MGTPTRIIGTVFETTIRSMARNLKVFFCDIAITYAASAQSLSLLVLDVVIK